MKKNLGVYICHCGGNISDYVDVEKVRQAIEHEEGVVLAKTTMFACSDSNQKEMVKSDRQKSKPVSKTEAMAVFIADKLQEGMVPANEILELYKGMQLSDRTIRNAKKQLGIVSIRKDGQWYWSLPNDKGETNT